MNLLISGSVASIVVAVFFMEIGMRNGEIRALEQGKDRLIAQVEDLRHEIEELRDEVEELEDDLQDANERCKKLEEDIENDENVIKAREELDVERKARRDDQRCMEDVTRHKDEILVVVTVFGLVTLFIGSMISLIVILRSSGHIH